MTHCTKTAIGSLLGAATLALAVASPSAAAFDAPQALSPEGFTSSFPEVALASDGTATVAWTQYENPLPVGGPIPYMVGTARVAGDGTAEPPVVLGDGGVSDVVVDGDGTATTLWGDCSDTFPVECVSRYIRVDAAGSAGPVGTIGTAGGAFRAHAADADSLGRILVAWTRLEGEAGNRTESVDVAWISADGVPGEPFTVTRTDKQLSDLVLSFDAKDRAVLAWKAWRDDGESWPSVHAAVIRPDGAAGPDRIVIGSEKRQQLEQLALSGNRLVTRRVRKKGLELRESLLISEIRGDGTATKPTRIAAPPGLRFFWAPQIETAADGRSLVAWNAEAIGAAAIDRDGSVSKPVAISGREGRRVRGVDLAMESDGKAVAAWKRGTGRIELARFNRRGRPKPAELGVKRPTALQRPIVALDDEGRVTLVWEEGGRVLQARDG